MLTAKNYAAQAERGLIEFSKKFISGTEWKKDREMAVSVSELIYNSVKFALPDNGNILGGGLTSLIDQTIRLPYESIVLEYYNKDAKEKIVIIAYEQDNKIIVFGATSTSYAKNDMWVLDPFCHIMESKFIANRLNTAAKIISPELYELSKKLNSHNKEYDHKRISHHSRVVLEFLEALSCKNISTVNHQDESIANSKRISAGKLPFYETKILVVNAVPNSSSCGKSGPHSSPRQHLRRGHIRRLKTGNIWVNSCVVGDSAKGYIDKSYRVSA